MSQLRRRVGLQLLVCAWLCDIFAPLISTLPVLLGQPPVVDNPEYKGPWTPTMIDNPEYKGEWEHPVVANPDYAPETYAKYESLGYVGFELWTVNSGSVFDNVLVTDDAEYAAKAAAETFEKITVGEKEALDAYKKANEPEEAPADEEGEEDLWESPQEEEGEHSEL